MISYVAVALGLAAAMLLILLVRLSIWRTRLRLKYETWQMTHEVLAVVIVALALSHAVMVGHYLDDPWQQALWITLTVSLVGVLGWTRLIKPLRQYRRPWSVESVTPELGTHGLSFSCQWAMKASVSRRASSGGSCSAGHRSH